MERDNLISSQELISLQLHLTALNLITASAAIEKRCLF